MDFKEQLKRAEELAKQGSLLSGGKAGYELYNGLILPAQAIPPQCDFVNYAPTEMKVECDYKSDNLAGFTFAEMQEAYEAANKTIESYMLKGLGKAFDFAKTTPITNEMLFESNAGYKPYHKLSFDHLPKAYSPNYWVMPYHEHNTFNHAAHYPKVGMTVKANYNDPGNPYNLSIRVSNPCRSELADSFAITLDKLILTRLAQKGGTYRTGKRYIRVDPMVTPAVPAGAIDKMWL
jgi:hypothetical protein